MFFVLTDDERPEGLVVLVLNWNVRVFPPVVIQLAPWAVHATNVGGAVPVAFVTWVGTSVGWLAM